MGNVIQFPNKKDFISSFRGKIPDKLLDEIAIAYDRVKEIAEEYPKGKFYVDESAKVKVKTLFEAQEKYVAEVLERLLKLEIELILSPYTKST